MLTLTLSPKVESMLCEKASREGTDPRVVAESVLEYVLEWERRDREEAIEGIRRGLEDSKAGRVRPIGETFAKMQAALRERGL